MSWISTKPTPKTLVIDCYNCGFNMGCINIDGTGGGIKPDGHHYYFGELITCIRCQIQFCFDQTVDKKHDIDSQREKFDLCMNTILTECKDFCFFLQ